MSKSKFSERKKRLFEVLGDQTRPYGVIVSSALLLESQLGERRGFRKAMEASAAEAIELRLTRDNALRFMDEARTSLMNAEAERDQARIAFKNACEDRDQWSRRYETEVEDRIRLEEKMLREMKRAAIDVGSTDAPRVILPSLLTVGQRVEWTAGDTRMEGTVEQVKRDCARVAHRHAFGPYLNDACAADLAIRIIDTSTSRFIDVPVRFNSRCPTDHSPACHEMGDGPPPTIRCLSDCPLALAWIAAGRPSQ